MLSIIWYLNTCRFSWNRIRFEQQAVSKTAEITSGTSFIEEKSGSTGLSGCVDIDECLKDHGCHRFADCINSPGRNLYKYFDCLRSGHPLYDIGDI